MGFSLSVIAGLALAAVCVSRLRSRYAERRSVQTLFSVSAPLPANVQRFFVLLIASVIALPATRAAVCDPKTLHGPYGFSLTGSTTIGGPTRPVAVVGRLIFGESGNLAGVSSASFTGLTLGNPVTGKYEAHTDCSVQWKLQDDSGAFQHFSGTMSADGGRVSFRQTDQGGAGNGILVRTMHECSKRSLAGKFNLAASGSTVDVGTAVESLRVSLDGLLIADGTGGLSFAAGPNEPAPLAGTYDVQGDCFVDIALELAAGETHKVAMHFRAILVETGREVIGIQTDPGTTVSLRLLSP
jgi:hypothetical protein